MNSVHTSPTPRFAHGFTLIEMMVAMVIGLLLTIAISSFFLTSKRNFTSTDDSARLQENMRFANQLLTRNIRQTGYRASPLTLTTGTTFIPGAFPAGANSAGLFGTDGGGTVSDSIKIRFQGSGPGTSSARATMATVYMTADDGNADGTIVDCRGYKVDSHLIALNEYSIAAGANGSNALFCNGSEIVPDVDNMQIAYGIETDVALSDSNYGPNYYVTASSLTSANMDQVTAVKIGLLFRSANASSDVTISRTYNLVGTTIPSFADKRSRRAMVVTVSLRNRPIKDIGGT